MELRITETLRNPTGVMTPNLVRNHTSYHIIPFEFGEKVLDI